LIGSAARVAPAPDEFPNFKSKLGLTEIQEKQMQKIWRDARSRSDQLAQGFHEFDRLRDDSVTELLTPEQKQKYDEIQRKRDAQVSALHGEISKIMENAHKETEAILTPEQLPKFKEIVKQHSRRHGPPLPMRMGGPPHHHGRPGPDSRPGDGPTTAPAI
ncbi:MAG TPA: Spy/CpxP family protein refolding chaperone, partial [Humisphaera sp.]|nr:Spy/CpxP family protein refolding chaperone [Humisphaera sp.]